MDGWPLESGWRALCKLLEYSGHGVPWFILSAVLFLQGATVLALRLLYALVGDIIVLATLKGAFRRQRPRYNAGKHEGRDARWRHGCVSWSWPARSSS